MEQPIVPLQLRSQGEAVVKLQKQLYGLGYDIGIDGIDGIFGQATRQAVVRFQQEEGLTADGVAGVQTLTRLTILGLDGNQITNLSGIQTLSEIDTLALSRNQITDLSPLQTLTNLTALDLSDNEISDTTPLKPLTNLQLLNLQDNSIDDKTCPVSPEVCEF